MENERLELYVEYTVIDGEMLTENNWSDLSANDLAGWREEDRYPELFALLDSGINKIVEMKCGECQPSLWLAANDPRLPSEADFYSDPEIMFSIF